MKDDFLKNIKTGTNDSESAFQDIVTDLMVRNKKGKEKCQDLDDFDSESTMPGLLIPGNGEIFVDGVLLGESTVDEIRQKMALVFQNPDNQIVGVTLEEDVAFGLENLRINSKKIEESVTNSLKKVGMSKYRYRSTNELSGGQKQRLSISSVLAMKPKCIVFDEVTSMLDPTGRKDVLEIMEDSSEDKTNLVGNSINFNGENKNLNMNNTGNSIISFKSMYNNKSMVKNNIHAKNDDLREITNWSFLQNI